MEQDPDFQPKPEVIALTKREQEVFRLIALGETSGYVAQKLGMSKRTVDFHLASVYRKFSVTNRIEATRVALQLGLIQIDERA